MTAIPSNAVTIHNVETHEIIALCEDIHTRGCDSGRQDEATVKLFALLEMADRDAKNLIIAIALEYFYTQTDHFSAAYADGIQAIAGDFLKRFTRQPKAKTGGKA